MKNLITIINSKELQNIWFSTKKFSSTIQDESNSMHHEHLGVASKSDVSNTPTADETGYIIYKDFNNCNENGL